VSSGHQGSPVHRIELQGPGEQPHGFGARRCAPPALEVAYPTRAETGALRQFILAQPSLKAVPAQELPEASRRDRIHAALLCVREWVGSREYLPRS